MEYKILSIGNSFAVDTLQHVVEVAKTLNINIKIYSLFIGGCSINRHYDNLVNDTNSYEFFVNEGEGFVTLKNITIKEALKLHKYDYINIQHGSGDGSRYTDFSSYSKIVDIITIIKNLINYDVKFIFNMTWVGEETFNHPELISYNKDQYLMYSKICDVMKNHISKIKEIDYVSYTGTAIQNARKMTPTLLTRDGYHLSLTLGRYIAALNFLYTIFDFDINEVRIIKDITDDERDIAIKSVLATHDNPFLVL